jgi:hypothetical protein
MINPTEFRTTWLPRARRAECVHASWREGGRIMEGVMVPATAGFPVALVIDSSWLHPLWVTDEEAVDILTSSSHQPARTPLDDGLTTDLLWDADEPDVRLTERRKRLEEKIRLKAEKRLQEELRRIGVI